MARKSSTRARPRRSLKGSSGSWRTVRRRNSEAARPQALANLAHELRTPLQVLLGYLEILRDEWADGFAPEPREMLERMNVSLHDLSHTVDNIMEFVLAEAGGMMRVRERVSPSSVLNDLAPAFEAACSGKEVALNFDLHDAPQTLEIARRPLRSILSNLVLNALKFTERGSVTVRIGRAENGGGLKIEVADTGAGIEPALIKLVSRPFAQLSHSNSRQYRGLGLGLAVVHRNARALGAEVEIHSVPGAGSRFVVRIPAAANAAGARKGGRALGRDRSSGTVLAPPPRHAAAGEAAESLIFL